MQEELGSVRGLWRYPVKSLRGEALDLVELDARGVVGDRVWALRDADGKLASGKTTRRFRKVMGLMQHSARYEGEEPVVTLADSGELPASDDVARRMAGDGWRMAREADVPHHDAAPLHLVTSATLATLAQAAGHPVEVDRLRPNILVDAGAAEGFAEDAWLGRELLIGDARLRVLDRTERCVMPTHAQAGLEPRRRLLKTIGRANEACAGVYLEVLEPGPIRLGDWVRQA
ncbi:MAG TPA: MOSC domain-containing protein [Thermoleophilaceae bacterium]|nr:MOSC domain-containing protein [Thermoleophilaceae bacterium]